MAKEALKKGDTEAAGQILFKAQLVAARLGDLVD
jgi:hypothetical protein